MLTYIKKLLPHLTSLLTFIALSLLAVRILLFPLFVELEYRTPGFPADEYGLTQAERLKYAHIARRYILSDPAVPSLADQRFPEGQLVPEFSCQFMTDCNLMYNEREVQHMLDVKNTVSSAMLILGISFLSLLGLGGYARVDGWWPAYHLGLRRGAWLTIFAIGGIIAFVLLAFGVIFVFFHQVFFASGTWVFYYSDTLIRLFPERFWRDAFIAVGLFAAGQAALLLYLTRPRLPAPSSIKPRPSKKS